MTLLDELKAELARLEWEYRGQLSRFNTSKNLYSGSDPQSQSNLAIVLYQEQQYQQYYESTTLPKIQALQEQINTILQQPPPPPSNEFEAELQKLQDAYNSQIEQYAIEKQPYYDQLGGIINYDALNAIAKEEVAFKQQFYLTEQPKIQALQQQINAIPQNTAIIQASRPITTSTQQTALSQPITSLFPQTNLTDTQKALIVGGVALALIL